METEIAAEKFPIGTKLNIEGRGTINSLGMETITFIAAMLGCSMGKEFDDSFDINIETSVDDLPRHVRGMIGA